MTTSEILTTLRDALAADDVFVAWCQDNIGSAPAIQIDFDDQQEIDDFPMVAFIQISQDDGLLGARQQWTVTGSVFVKNNGRTQTTSNGCKLITYDGRLECEGLREAAIAAIYRAKIGKIVIKGESMSHTYHPRYISPFIIQIETTKAF